MKASVNAESCIGCGLCVDLCPKVFEMVNVVAVAKPGVVPKDAEASCREAADSCPVAAITVA